MADWKLINAETPEGIPLLLWCPQAHRGIGSCEILILYHSDGELDFWTNGGPNAGDDIYFNKEETPTHWDFQPVGPNGENQHVL